MWLFSSTNLAKKLTISAITLLASCIIGIMGMTYMTIIHFGNDFLASELSQKSEFIRKAFIGPIWTFDQYQIEEIGNSLLGDFKYTYISAIRVETSTYDLLFEKGYGENTTFVAASKLPFTKTNVIDIYKDQKKIGIVSVAMTNYGYVKAFKDQFLILIIAATILLIILAYMVSYYFNRILTRPLGKILEQVHHIENDNPQTQILENLPKELATISRALNQAASTIEKRNSDIMYYTNDLEKLVQERTSELEEQMSKNLNTARLAAVGELAADVAHEINNPLTVIDLHATKLKRYEIEHHLSPAVIHSIDKIQLMIKRIGKIIKGLKSLSRDGNSDPMVSFPISNIIEDVKALVEVKLRTNEIDFEVIAPNLDLLAVGREVQISQVMVNLIGNAVDAIMALENKWIRIEISESNEKVHFIITDSGKGIPEAILEKMMHPFFTTKDVNKGTVLGLSISKSIIEEHGGSLEYNRLYPNTQFIFKLKKGSASKLSA
jgi:two-component system NtrC family sensor kinase